MGQNVNFNSNSDEAVSQNPAPHAMTGSADDPAPDPDVEGHGLVQNLAAVAVLSVGGGAALAAPSSAAPVDDTAATVTQAEGWTAAMVPAEQIAAYITEALNSVPPEMVTGPWKAQLSAYFSEALNSVPPEMVTGPWSADEISGHITEALKSVPPEMVTGPWNADEISGYITEALKSVPPESVTGPWKSVPPEK